MIAMLRTFFCSVIGCSLSQCFVKHDTDRSGKIQAADFRIEHGNAQAVAPVFAQQWFGQTARFRAKNEAIVGCKRPVGVEPFRFRGEINETRLRRCAIERFEVCVSCELHFRPVVETGASQRAIVHAKAGDADDVQWSVGGGTQSRDVAGVGWNLRFDECDGKHEESIGRKRREWSDAKTKKKRRASLEGLVVSFVRPGRPRMFVCAGGRYVL